MPQLPLDPVPNTPIQSDPTQDAIWKRWFERLRFRTTQPGQIDHEDLAGLQGGTTGEHEHLTDAQHTTLTAAKSANTVYAGPTSGGAAVPAFRALVAADIPAAVQGNNYFAAVHG